VFILLGIHVITSRRVERTRGGGDGSKHVNGKINYQLQKFTPLGLISRVTVLYFAPLGEGKKRRGPMPVGLFTPPSGRDLVIPVFVTPPSGRDLVIPVFCFHYYPAVRTGCSNTHFLIFFSRSLAPDLRFLLGQTNLRCKFPLYLWARILSDRNIFFTLWEGRITAGSNAPGAFLVIYFFGGHLPQTSGVRSAKQIHVVSFVTQARACILSDHNIFYIPRGWRTSAGLNVPVAFLVFVFFTPPSARGLVIPVFFLSWSVVPDLRSVKTILAGKRCSFSVYSPEFS